MKKIFIMQEYFILLNNAAYSPLTSIEISAVFWLANIYDGFIKQQFLKIEDSLRKRSIEYVLFTDIIYKR